MLRSAWRICRMLAVIYLGVLLALLFFEKSLVFVPTKYAAGARQPPKGVEEVQFAAADGTLLNGWFAGHDQPRAVVLHAHGNGGNMTYLADVLRAMRDDLGVSILVFDYRGYGCSEGSPDEAGVLQDARAARDWLAQRTGVREADIVLMGQSLGTGVMVDLAANEGARGLILHSAYTSLPDVAAQVYPWLPVRWLMRTRLDSLSKINRYPGPVLQFHGDADEIIPFAIGQTLHAAVPNEAKVWRTMPGCQHNNLIEPPFYDAISKWIDTLAPMETE